MGVQWCLGMYSSGSTWIFNALRSVAEVVLPDKRHTCVYAESVEEFPPGWSKEDSVIIKSHHPRDTATALLLEKADRI